MSEEIKFHAKRGGREQALIFQDAFPTALQKNITKHPHTPQVSEPQNECKHHGEAGQTYKH